MLAFLRYINYNQILSAVKNAYMDGFPSGQRGQTVNLLQIASVVRIHLHPFAIHSILQCTARNAGVAELADAQDLKSCGTNLPYRFDSGRRHLLCVFARTHLRKQVGFGASHEPHLRKQAGFGAPHEPPPSQAGRLRCSARTPTFASRQASVLRTNPHLRKQSLLGVR